MTATPTTYSEPAFRVRRRLLDSRRGIAVAFANSLMSLFVLDSGASLAFVNGIASVSFAVLGVLLWLQRGNLLFFTRTLVIGVIGYFAMVVKVFAGPDALFSGYERSTQGMDVVIVMYVTTSLALLSNEIGLYLSHPRDSQPRPRLKDMQPHLWRTIFIVGVPAVLGVSYLVMRVYVDTVLTSGYGGAATETGADLPLGNTINSGIVCLLAMFVALRRFGGRRRLVIFAGCAFVFLIIAMFLRGQRQDVLTSIFGLMVCYGLAKGRSVGLTPKMVFVGLMLVLIFEAWGLARGAIAVGGVEVLGLAETVLWGRFTGDIVRFGTVSPIATTFSNTVWLIDSGTVPLALGRSYWEFIPRTPPAFLYPDRPQDYAWMFEDYGLLAGGGFFELGEAYMNFGLAGGLIVPGIISFLMARSFYNVLSKQTVFSYFLLFTFLGVFLRATWYQTFAFYRGFWTAMVLYICLLALHRVLVNAAPPVAAPRAAATAA